MPRIGLLADTDLPPYRRRLGRPYLVKDKQSGTARHVLPRVAAFTLEIHQTTPK